MTQDERWLVRYNEVKSFIETNHRNPSKYNPISIIPVDCITQLPIGWTFLCEDYQKDGCMLIKVEPLVEEQHKTIVVYKEEDVKPDEVTISPKIIEEKS